MNSKKSKIAILITAIVVVGAFIFQIYGENIADGLVDGLSGKEPATISHEARPARKILPLPPFPNYPAPISKLAEVDEGDIYFASKSPYDFSRVLSGFDRAPETTSKGTLILPEGASADNPVPVMVILHGSGGIKEGREFTYANWFAENGIAGFVVDYYSPRGVT